MVFSFFRKDKQPDSNEAKPAKAAPAAAVKPQAGAAVQNPVKPDSTAKPNEPIAQEETSTEMGLGGYAPLDGITVSEGSSEISSVAEEAAIFFANDRPDQAIMALRQHLQESAEQQDYQPWLMLFDLYHLQGMKQAFEELALEFVVKFERSPPAWVGKEVEEVKAAQPAAANYFALTGVLSADSESQFQQLHQVVKRAGNLRLELSKVKGIEASGSRLLLETLQGLRKSGIKIQYIGASNVINLLKQATQSAGVEEEAKFHWLLLMEFQQILGKQEDFEELAIDYAVTFEVSPPSWEPLAEQAVVEEAAEPALDQSATDKPDTFVISGVISGNSEKILKDMAEYAENRQEVHIDMSQVTRVDFICVGNFLNSLIQCFTNGKQVYIHEPNEMVLALFVVMGVDQFATIQRKKAR